MLPGMISVTRYVKCYTYAKCYQLWQCHESQPGEIITSDQINVTGVPTITCRTTAASLGQENVHLVCGVRSRAPMVALFWTNNDTDLSDDIQLDNNTYRHYTFNKV